MKLCHFPLAVLLLLFIAGCHGTRSVSGVARTTQVMADPAPQTIAAPAPQASVAPATQSRGAPKVASVPMAESGIMTIIKPVQAQRPEDAPLTNPVEFCMSIKGYTVEPAKNGDNEGKGHHHILIDVPLPRPEDMTNRMAKDQNNLHLGNGADCKKVNLTPGAHTVRAIFSYGSHIPYNPPISASVIIFVK